MENQAMYMPHNYVVDDEGTVCPKGSGFNGKYTSLPAGYRKKLSAPIPKEMISKHPTKTFLSVIKAIAIVERMDDVFGLQGWNLEHEIVETTTVAAKEGQIPYIVMKGRMYVRKYDLYTPYQFGGHQLSGRGTEPADGYKSAVTDIQSKCASYLEIGIQVFKGQPNSQVANVSKQEAETEKKVAEEKGAEQMLEKSKTLAEPVKKEEPKKKAAAPKKKAEPKAEEIKVEKAVVIPQDTDGMTAVERAKAEINSYVSPKELKENAQVIVFNATMDDASDEEVAEIKAEINVRYKQLLN